MDFHDSLQHFSSITSATSSRLHLCPFRAAVGKFVLIGKHYLVIIMGFVGERRL